MLFYSLGLLAAILLTSPYWLLRMAASGRYRDGLAQRLGAVPRGLREFVGDRRAIWLHAVSVGEVIAASRLVEILDGMGSDFPVVISTTTRTGQALAQERFGGSGSERARVFYYPFDFAWMVRRYLRVLKPRIVVLMESELWPRMLMEAHRRSIPVVVVNGRVSDRSLPRYRAMRRLWKPFLRMLTRVLAQSEPDAERFLAIGVPAAAVETAGNLKFDVRSGAESEVARQLRAQIASGTRVIVAGSTLEGEEDYLLQAFRELSGEFPELTMVLAPRHPERFQAVQQRIQQMNLPCIQRSEWLLQPRPVSPGSVFLLDSIGELASVYSLATVAFIGGSMVPAGGHNPLEPAQFAVPIATGPYTENFRGVVGMLLAQGAIRVTPPERLTATLRDLLTSTENAAMGARARKVFEEYAGASERCFVAIQKILAERMSLFAQPEGKR